MKKKVFSSGQFKQFTYTTVVKTCSSSINSFAISSVCMCVCLRSRHGQPGLQGVISVYFVPTLFMTVPADMQPNPNTNVCAFFLLLHRLNVKMLFSLLVRTLRGELTHTYTRKLQITVSNTYSISVRVEMTSSF